MKGQPIHIRKGFEFTVQIRCKFFASCPAAVNDSEATPCLLDAESDCPGPSTGTDNRHVLAADNRFFSQRLDGSGTIRIIAMQNILAVYNRVDGTNFGSQRIHLIQIFHDTDFMGNRNAGAPDTQTPDAVYGSSDVYDSECMIVPIEACLGQGAVMHDRT